MSVMNTRNHWIISFPSPYRYSGERSGVGQGKRIHQNLDIIDGTASLVPAEISDFCLPI